MSQITNRPKFDTLALMLIVQLVFRFTVNEYGPLVYIIV